MPGTNPRLGLVERIFGEPEQDGIQRRSCDLQVQQLPPCTPLRPRLAGHLNAVGKSDAISSRQMCPYLVVIECKGSVSPLQGRVDGDLTSHAMLARRAGRDKHS